MKKEKKHYKKNTKNNHVLYIHRDLNFQRLEARRSTASLSPRRLYYQGLHQLPNIHPAKTWTAETTAVSRKKRWVDNAVLQEFKTAAFRKFLCHKYADMIRSFPRLQYIFLPAIVRPIAILLSAIIFQLPILLIALAAITSLLLNRGLNMLHIRSNSG